MKVIEIYGNEVVPKVKKHFKDKENKKKIKVLSLKYLLNFIWSLV